MLNWTKRFNIFCFLDNNGYLTADNAFEYILAAGCRNSISIEGNDGLKRLQQFYDDHPDWLFGHMGYDLLNENTVEKMDDGEEVDFGAGFFFNPEVLVSLNQDTVHIECATANPENIFREINEQDAFITNTGTSPVHFRNGISREEYENVLSSLKKHIHRGDCYEINYCQSFYADAVKINPVHFYLKLSGISPNPFAALYRIRNNYCICASPERFIRKSADQLISQPIKGTIKRRHDDPEQDNLNKLHLLNSEKERSENVMIVDLVRNDLSKVCREGSVVVKELFGIYSFPQVHQMISTIEGKLEETTKWTEILAATFPMGSMTGAPKKKVIELIAKYEKYPRGLFSGSIGYIKPNGDFDFNVVIRSLMYDEANNRISFKAGGGITFNSDTGSEYEESLLKAEAIMNVLSEN